MLTEYLQSRLTKTPELKPSTYEGIFILGGSEMRMDPATLATRGLTYLQSP